MRKFTLIITLTVALASEGCADPPPVQSTTSPVCPPATTEIADATAEAAKPVTFYGDLLPILSSTRRGETYKCTTCHAHYREPGGLNSVSEVERVVASMRSGRMPRGGDAVPSAKIELFTVWRLQGFQPGLPKTAAETAREADATPAASQGGCVP